MYVIHISRIKDSTNLAHHFQPAKVTHGVIPRRRSRKVKITRSNKNVMEVDTTSKHTKSIEHLRVLEVINILKHKVKGQGQRVNISLSISAHQ